jgi:aquaporin Z
MVMIYACAGISGSNFNPAVSLALLINKNMDANTAGIYICTQLLAGILAGLTYGVTLWKVFNLAPTPGFKWYQAGLAELIYTFMLCFVVLNVAIAKKNKDNQYFGLAIGFVVIAGGYGAGHISGGCFNPAVAFGIDVSSAGIGFGWCFVYTIFEFIGAALAAVLFKVVRPEEADDVETLGQKTSAMLASEFLGTYMLVLTVGLNVIGASKAPVFSIAASLMCMIYALGSASGAHFNPAVTLSILLSSNANCENTNFRDFNAGIAVKYMGAQIIGGICAGFTYLFLEGGKSFALQPGAGYGWVQAGIAEVFYTFVLCYVVLCVACVQRKSKPLGTYFGLAIGSCVTAGGYAVGAVSGGSLNPAVSFGIAFAHVVNGGGLVYAVAYTIFEFVGAALAATVFANTHAAEVAKRADGVAGQA